MTEQLANAPGAIASILGIDEFILGRANSRADHLSVEMKALLEKLDWKRIWENNKQDMALYGAIEARLGQVSDANSKA